MNPLTLPVGIVARVLGDLAAVAAAARAVVPVAQAAGEMDLRQMQDDMHVLAEARRALPEVVPTDPPDGRDGGHRRDRRGPARAGHRGGGGDRRVAAGDRGRHRGAEARD